MKVLEKNVNYAQKDTVLVPYGGYTVIRFVGMVAVTPSHRDKLTIEGMAVVIKKQIEKVCMMQIKYI